MVFLAQAKNTLSRIKIMEKKFFCAAFHCHSTGSLADVFRRMFSILSRILFPTRLCIMKLKAWSPMVF
jgi:hypothetical protein